jgi:hypothetical protein
MLLLLGQCVVSTAVVTGTEKVTVSVKVILHAANCVTPCICQFCAHTKVSCTLPLHSLRPTVPLLSDADQSRSAMYVVVVASCLLWHKLC